MKRTTTMTTILAAVTLALAGATATRAAEPGDAMLTEYLAIHDALASDRADGVAAAAAKIATLASGAKATPATKDAYARVAAAAGAMTGTQTGPLRDGLKELSKAMFAAVGSAADLYYCPMIDGYWLQKKGDAVLRNPYYGKSMLRCGEKVDKVED